LGNGGTREARKVQITGKSTHFVSLPKRWIDSARIRGGDLIYLVPQHDGRLVIEPLGLRPVRDGVSLQLWIADSSPEWVLRQIAAAYVAGWSQIDLPGGLPGRLGAAGLRAAFLGLDVLEEPDGLTVLRISCETNLVEPLAGLRRLRSIVRWRLGSAQAQSVAADPIDAPSPEEFRRHAFYLLRQTTELSHDGVQARRLGLRPGEAACLHRAVRALLRIEDAAERLAGVAVGPDIVDLVELALRGVLAEPMAPEPAPWRALTAARRRVFMDGADQPAFPPLLDVIDGCAEILGAAEDRFYCRTPRPA
jgi:hypothetical protein